jgi:hypothetical protein
MIAKIKRTFQPVAVGSSGISVISPNFPKTLAETKRQPEQAFIIRAKAGINVNRSEFDKNRPDLIWAAG